MKRILLSMMLMMAACMGAVAMNFERAQAEALYLTDKMAYELNLNDQQYNDAYEINLDYFLRMDSRADLDGYYHTYRLNDLRCILHDWQYGLMLAADYFVRPLLWHAGGWYFPIYAHYNRGFFYFSHPTVWRTYRGGHSRIFHRDGFYANRRPMWNGGLRGHDMHRPAPPVHRPSSGMGNHGGGNRIISGKGYHIDMGGRQGRGGHSANPAGHAGSQHGGAAPGGHAGTPRGGMSQGGHQSRGNSFDGSSSRMGSGSMSGSRGTMSGSRGGSFGGSSRSMGSGMGSSRGGSFGGSSRGGGMSGGASRGGGQSRSGRR